MSALAVAAENNVSPTLLIVSAAVLFALFEELSRWLAFVGTATMQRRRDWGAALVYGAGHGAAEALRFNFLGMALPVLAATYPLQPVSSLLLLPIWPHRAPAILLQCGLAVLVMYGVLCRRPRYLILATAGHAIADASWLILLAAGATAAADGLLIAAGLVSISVALALRMRWPQPADRSIEAARAEGRGIAVRNLVHTYPAAEGEAGVHAINGLDLSVEPGQVVALLGHNGAGKTTTLRILGGLLKPTAGQAMVRGIDVTREPDRVRWVVGLQSEEPGLYRHMRVTAYLDFFAKLYGIPADQRTARIESLLLRLGLKDKRQAPSGSLSKGNRQKVALARTLIHQPEILLLDEPTSGLDPAVSVLVRDLISDLRAEHRTIILATHNLHEAQTLADEVAIVHHGRLVRQGTVRELHDNGTGKHFVLRIAPSNTSLEPLLSQLRQIESLADIQAGSDRDNPAASAVSFITDAPEQTNPRVLGLALDMGFQPYALSETRPTLEEIYLGIDRELKNGERGEDKK